MQSLLKQIRRNTVGKMKIFSRAVPKHPTKEIMDPLRLYEGMEQPVTFAKMIRDIEQRRAYLPNSTSIAVYLYWMSKFDISSEYIVNATNGELDLVKGKFGAREAFGFYCGALGLNVPKSILALARDEFSRVSSLNLTGKLNRS